MTGYKPLRLFLSTLSVRRATGAALPFRPHRQISIHALREESDGFAEYYSLQLSQFLSTLSVRRATHSLLPLSLLSCISIHALREESDRLQQKQIPRYHISIHALREESDEAINHRLDSGDFISIHALREESDD